MHVPFRSILCAALAASLAGGAHGQFVSCTALTDMKAVGLQEPWVKYEVGRVGGKLALRFEVEWTGGWCSIGIRGRSDGAKMVNLDSYSFDSNTLGKVFEGFNTATNQKPGKDASQSDVVVESHTPNKISFYRLYYTGDHNDYTIPNDATQVGFAVAYGDGNVFPYDSWQKHTKGLFAAIQLHPCSVV